VLGLIELLAGDSTRRPAAVQERPAAVQEGPAAASEERSASSH